MSTHLKNVACLGCKLNLDPIKLFNSGETAGLELTSCKLQFLSSLSHLQHKLLYNGSCLFFKQYYIIRYIRAPLNLFPTSVTEMHVEISSMTTEQLFSTCSINHIKEETSTIIFWCKGIRHYWCLIESTTTSSTVYLCWSNKYPLFPLFSRVYDEVYEEATLFI